MSGPLTPDQVAAAIHRTAPRPPIPDRDIAQMVAEATARLFAVTFEQLRDSRTREHVEARQVAMAVTRARTGMSWPELGRWFQKDHTTVMHAVARVMKDPDKLAWAHAVEAAMTPTTGGQP